MSGYQAAQDFVCLRRQIDQTAALHRLHDYDRLSLALALGEDRDERVEEVVEEMLQQVWRDIDG